MVYLSLPNFLNFWGISLLTHHDIDPARPRGVQRGNLIQQASSERARTWVSDGSALGGETVGGQTQCGLQCGIAARCAKDPDGGGCHAARAGDARQER